MCEASLSSLQSLLFRSIISVFSWLYVQSFLGARGKMLEITTSALEYHETFSKSCTKSQHHLKWLSSCLTVVSAQFIGWSQVLSQEWCCIWSSMKVFISEQFWLVLLSSSISFPVMHYARYRMVSGGWEVMTHWPMSYVIMYVFVCGVTKENIADKCSLWLKTNLEN